MRAVIVRCPNCGATLEAAHTVAAVTCSYCGTTSRIQARSRVFQVARPLPRPPTDAPPMPVARQRFRMIGLLPFVLTAALAGGVALYSRTRLGLGGSRSFWAGEVPVLLDVDGDGVGDPIGIVRYILNGDRAHLAAYSGKTGAQLWQSESLGTFSDLGQLDLATVGDLVLIASDSGGVAARGKLDGALRWSLSFSEKAEVMCQAPTAGEIVIGLADKQWFVVDAQGKRRAGQPLVRLEDDYTKDTAVALFMSATAGVETTQQVCVPVDNRNWRHPAGLLALPRWHDIVDLPSMSVSQLIRHPGGPIVALGKKHPGTPVPMLAGIDGTTARWSVEIAAVDPLVSRFEEKMVALTDTDVIVLYQPKSPARPRITAFALATGNRRWDREVAHGKMFNPTGIVVAGDVVLLSSWTAVYGYELADGRERFLIGDR